MVQQTPGQCGMDLERLLVKHERPIRRYIERRSGPAVLRRTTVDDIFQQVVASALTSAASFEFRGDGAFIQWMNTIVRRAIARCATTDSQGPGVVRIRGPKSSGVGIPEAQLHGPGRTPSSIASGSERKAALARAISQLPEDYRRVLSLYKLEERPLCEVAARMGRTKGAVCRLVARGMHALRNMLECR